MFCVCQKYIEKECLLTSWIKKKALKTLRTTVYEKRKIRIFPKGLVHRFGKKLKISLSLIFIIKIDQEKVSGNVLVRKKVCIILFNPLSPLVIPCNPLSPLVTCCNPLSPLVTPCNPL